MSTNQFTAGGTSPCCPRGGHILSDTSVVGPQPIPVLVTALRGFDLRVTYDPETNIPLLQPHEENPDE